MSDEKKPLDFPTTPAAAEGAAKAREAEVAHHAKMLDIAVRHLYGTALTVCRLTGGNMSDVPRILVAAGAHSVQSLIEKLAAMQKAIDNLPTDHPHRDSMVTAANTMAGDLDQTMSDFEGALTEALVNMQSLRTVDEEPAAGDAKIEPQGGAPVH